MEWIYEDKPYDDPQGYCGFIYVIEEISTGKKYFGKKNFYFRKTKSVKGKKKKIQVESDWKDYWSSSDILKKDVEEKGKDEFTRKILRLCSSKSELSYYESKIQFEYDVLLKPQEFYNEWISCRITRKHLTKLIDKERKQ